MSILIQLLSQQEQQLDNMLSLLNQEFELLKQRKALSLPDISTQKQELLGRIADTDQAISRLLDSHPIDDVFITLSSRIQEKLQECHGRNEINGKLIELSLVSNRRLAHILSELHEKNSMTYDNKGNTKNTSGGSLNIKA